MIHLLILVVLTSGCLHATEISAITVDRIIDGDTIELSNGETIRFLCIDTPEVGEDGYEEATLFTSQILGKEITLEKGNENRDKYGRLLRIVYFYNNTKSLNEMLLENGLAKPFITKSNEDICNF